MYEWSGFGKQKNPHLIHKSLDLPICSFDWDAFWNLYWNLDFNLDFDTTVSRYIEIKVKENV